MSEGPDTKPKPDTGYEQRITAIREAITVQVAVLTELAAELEQGGHTDLGEQVTEVISMLENENHPFDRVKSVIPELKKIGESLHALGFKHAVLALNGARMVLSNRADRILCDTQPIDPVDLAKIKRDGKPKP